MHKVLQIVVLALACGGLIAPVRAQDTLPAPTQFLPTTWTELLIGGLAIALGGGGIVGLMARAYIKRKEAEWDDHIKRRDQKHEEEMTELNTQRDAEKRQDENLGKLIDRFGGMVDAMREGNKIALDIQQRQVVSTDLQVSSNKLLLDMNARLDKEVGGKLDTVRDMSLQILEVTRQGGTTIAERLESIEDILRRKFKTGPLPPPVPGPTLTELEQIGAVQPAALITPLPQLSE